MKILMVFIGGGVGSVVRYIIMVAISRIMGTGFPWHTLGVNLLGALVIGALTEFMSLRITNIETLRLLLMTGFLGGFTTFSAFSLDGALMWQKGDYLHLGFYIAASVIGTIAAVLCGSATVKAIF